jgi:HAD superfamily hydrolase (TIGR01509 family)
MLKAVIFDMDGVIIDSEPLHIEVVLNILKSLNINLEYNEIVKYIGISNSFMWNELSNKYNINIPVVELMEMQHSMNIKILDKHENIMLPGIIDLLEEIKKNKIETAIASSSTIDYINAVIQKLNILHYFNKIISGEQVVYGKPKPDIFIKIVELLGVSPKECVIIEDSDNGIRAAIDAGIKVIGLRNPNSGNQSLTGADYIVNSLNTINMQLLTSII